MDYIHKRHLTGKHAFANPTVFVDCIFDSAEISSVEDMYFAGTTTGSRSLLQTTKDIIIATGDMNLPNSQIHCTNLQSTGSIHCELCMIQEELTFFGDSKIGQIYATTIYGQGNLTVDHCVVRDSIDIDGDFIGLSVDATTITVKRGGLLFPEITTDSATADVIGNFGLHRLDQKKLHYHWTRPLLPFQQFVVERNLPTLILSAQQTINTLIPEDLQVKLVTPDSCAEFGPILEDALAKWRLGYDRLPPSIQEFIDCIDLSGFPSWLWRY